MMNIILDWCIPRDNQAAMQVVQFGLDATTGRNMMYLKKYATPPLYQSGVVYRPEKLKERWRDVPRTLAKGWGDCEDLSCWRAAELNLSPLTSGLYRAVAIPSRTTHVRFHIVVKYPDGKLEDPSRALGMDGHPIVRRPVFLKPAYA